MRIGITYDLKVEDAGRPPARTDLPDDLQEEFDSPATVEAIASVLRGLGHHVEKLGDGRELLGQLLAAPPEFVFNIAEGQGISRSREARVPAVLEMLGIPYSGSDPLTLAATLDKDCARRLVASEGVLVPKGVVLAPDDDSARVHAAKLPYPVIVKPAWEGSSKGIRNKCLVECAAHLEEVIDSLRRGYQQPILVEEFIEGEELTVGVIGNAPPRILGTLRVVPLVAPRHFIYSLEVKRDFRRQVRYECPSLPERVATAVEQSALTAFRILGCRDVSRIDFRLRDGKPYFLEVNPLPGLNPETSDLVILAQLCGWSHARLIESILQSALTRHGLTT
jgi:D-alanine-D-alanine ligase